MGSAAWRKARNGGAGANGSGGRPRGADLRHGPVAVGAGAREIRGAADDRGALAGAAGDEHHRRGAMGLRHGCGDGDDGVVGLYAGVAGLVGIAALGHGGARLARSGPRDAAVVRTPGFTGVLKDQGQRPTEIGAKPPPWGRAGAARRADERGGRCILMQKVCTLFIGVILGKRPIAHLKCFARLKFTFT